MAFDMHFQTNTIKKKEKIEHHEQFIFQLMEGNVKYPNANFTWDNFFNDPEIDTSRSNQLVHELLQFKNESRKHNRFEEINFIVDRLVLFFSAAYRNNAAVTSFSD